jgi:hypothetical protein
MFCLCLQLDVSCVIMAQSYSTKGVAVPVSSGSIIAITEDMERAGADVVSASASLETPEERAHLARMILHRALSACTAEDLGQVFGATRGETLVPLWNADGSLNFDCFDLGHIRKRLLLLRPAVNTGTGTVGERLEAEILITILRTLSPAGE